VSNLVLIKLGGAALQDESLVASICADIARLRRASIPVAVVHGGGPAINEELKLRGISWEFIGGQRVTTPSMMNVIEMVLCGQMNRKIVRALNRAGVPAVGLSGTDANLLLCRQASQELGLVGLVEHVDLNYLQPLLSGQIETGRGYVPVIAPVGVGRDGQAFNVNADWAASRIASELKVQQLIFMTDQAGILDKKGNLIETLDEIELEKLIDDGTVQGGMLTKVRTILSALDSGIPKVQVLNARTSEGLIRVSGARPSAAKAMPGTECVRCEAPLLTSRETVARAPSLC